MIFIVLLSIEIRDKREEREKREKSGESDLARPTMSFYSKKSRFDNLCIRLVRSGLYFLKYTDNH